MANPVLSIGIIFRDDIRSIERCLKALQPLRDAIACELVMADTGSKDGSRAVAEKYADILFDFPWINDFAAARNAVLERCTGEWFLAVDTDEYLDADITELLTFLRTSGGGANLCRVNIRNYKSYEMDGAYADFYTLRLVRLSTGVRYRGAIHEAWTGIDRLGHVIKLANTIFHHDGYVNMANNAEKLKRNMTLLRQKLKKEPQNLLIRLQIIESGIREEDYLEQIRKAVALVRRKPAGWNVFGPPILRYAVLVARDRKLSEFDKWAALARNWFPESYFTRLDVNAQCMSASYDSGDYTAAILQGEELMEAYADYRAGRGDMDCQVYSTLHCSSPQHENIFRLMLAVSYQKDKRMERCMEELEKLEVTQLDGALSNNLTKLLCSLRNESLLDTDALTRAIWKGVTSPVPSEKRAEERRRIFLLVGSTAFTPGYCREEEAKGQRHAYTLFTPLAGQCGLGTAAAILESEDPGEMTELLRSVEKWNELPFPALSHAIAKGVSFPLPDRPLHLEEMDNLARRLAGDWGALFQLVKTARDTQGDWQRMAWEWALVQAAVQNCRWDRTEEGWTLVQAYLRAEKAFQTSCYAPEALREDHLAILPPVNRFGWYCIQAFAARKAGRAVEYVRLLREGLRACPAMKHMADFLLENTPELQAPPESPAPELLELAEKVRALLAQYDPADPAVAVLKASSAYQKVAHLIESA